MARRLSSGTFETIVPQAPPPTSPSGAACEQTSLVPLLGAVVILHAFNLAVFGVTLGTAIGCGFVLGYVACCHVQKLRGS